MDELSVTYVAKHVAPYLSVTVPELPQSWKKFWEKKGEYQRKGGSPLERVMENIYSAYLWLADQRVYQENKEGRERERRELVELLAESEADDRRFRENLRTAGIINPTEFDAYMILLEGSRELGV